MGPTYLIFAVSCSDCARCITHKPARLEKGAYSSAPQHSACWCSSSAQLFRTGKTKWRRIIFSAPMLFTLHADVFSSSRSHAICKLCVTSWCFGRPSATVGRHYQLAWTWRGLSWADARLRSRWWPSIAPCDANVRVRFIANWQNLWFKISLLHKTVQLQTNSR